ncbi:MAG TPA: exonuclease domain-containing protein [Pseudomonadales bacterium]|nr:exonuclease domain-containing protein [Pseudomonadales bacterium]
MSRRSLDRRLLVGVLGLFAVPTLVATAALYLLYRRGVLADPTTLAVTLAVGGLTLMGYLAVVAHGLGRALVGHLRAIQRGAELIATVHPDHRIALRTGDELEALAEEINGLGDRLSAARRELDLEVARATRAFADERARLAAILADLDEGVVAVAGDGRISLANRVAKELLVGGAPLLGRSLLDLVEPEPVAGLLERVKRGELVSGRVELPRRGQGPLEAGVTPLTDADAHTIGLILAIRDPARSVEGAATTVPGGEVSPWPAAGLASGVGASVPGPPRPVLYDFSYFDTVAREAGGANHARRLADLTFVVLDTETTGLRVQEGHRVVSLAAVRVGVGAVRAHDTFDALVHPGRPIPAASTRFHGITDAMVAAAPPMEEVLPAFLRYAGEAPVVGHEITFDLEFLDAQALRLGLPRLAWNRTVLDTRLISSLVHGSDVSHSLEAVSERLGVTILARHSALGDALATAEVLVRLFDLLARRGITTLGELLEALERRPRP